jgi:hypothetical protein
LPAAVLVSIGCSVALRLAPLGLERAHDVLEVADRARQAVDAGDHQDIAFADEVENGLEFGAARDAGAALLLRTDHVSAGSARVVSWC